MSEPRRSPGRSPPWRFWSPRSGAPIAVQIMALLAAGLIAAQLTTLALTIFVPFRTPAFRLEDVAVALGGGALASTDGRSLVRTHQSTAPLETGVDWVTLRRSRRDLAELLRKSPAQVRLQFHWPPPMGGAPVQPRRGPGGGPPPDDHGPPGPPRFNLDSPPAMGPRPDLSGAASARGFDKPRGEGTASRGPREPPGFGRFVGGEFVAAVEHAPGNWTVVRPQPEGFPNAWQRRMLLWFAATFAVIAPLGYLFARRLVSPLTAFADAAERLGRDPAAPLLPLGGPAEIGRAARAFNDMRGRLRRYVEDRTGMIGAISHDLRTPLARLKFKIERTPEPERGAMLEDIRQMEAMISSVLTFIRDASEPGERERIDLRSLVECVVDDAALVGADATLDPGDPVTVEADTLAIQRVVTNLVENAVKYGGMARVRLTAPDGHAVVQVADDGPGLSPEDMERVFKPFYRSEAARTLDVGGVGLGLSISRSIARAHGGDVRLTPGIGAQPGLTVELRLPLPQRDELRGRTSGRLVRASRIP